MELNKKAFTLIELLVAVLIIGILAAIAVPKYQIAVEKSIMQEAILNVKAIAQANDRFFLANGRYANAYEMDKLDISIPGTIISTDNYYNKRIKTKYFIYSPDGDNRNIDNPLPDGYKAIAQRIPLQQRYALSITKENKLVCNYLRTTATVVQTKLCNQINQGGHL